MKPGNSFVRVSWKPDCSEGRPNFVDFVPVSSQKADTWGWAVSQQILVNKDRPILLHDNACPNTANRMQLKIRELDL